MAARAQPGCEPGGAADVVRKTTDAAQGSLDARAPQAEPLGLDQLRRQPGERHAEHMRRLREAGIFTAWPAVLDGELPRPFQIGIDRALALRLDPRRCEPATLRRLIGQMCRSLLYLHELARAGSMRHDVDGKPVEPVSAEHRAGARACLDHRASRRKEREATRQAELARQERVARQRRANAARPMLTLGREAS